MRDIHGYPAMDIPRPHPTHRRLHKQRLIQPTTATA